MTSRPALAASQKGCVNASGITPCLAILLLRVGWYAMMRREAHAYHTILVRALSTSGHPRHCGVESGITITPGYQTGRGSRRSRRKRVLWLTARSHAGSLD